MKTVVLGLLLMAGPGLGRCYDEDRSPTEYTAAAEKSSTSSNDTTSAPASVVPGVTDTTSDPLPPPRAAAVVLTPLGQGPGGTPLLLAPMAERVRGTAQLRSAGGGSLVLTTLAQGKASTTYDGAIRQGRCTRLGANVASLLPVTVDSLGGGRAASDVPVPMDSLLGRPHVLVYGKGGRPESCADLSAPAPAPPPPPPPAPLRPDSAPRPPSPR